MSALNEFTAEGLRAVATDEYGMYVLHRHGGDHDEGTDCWCSPLVLTSGQVFAMTSTELQQALDSFYRTH